MAPQAGSRSQGILRLRPLANETVLRDLRRSAKTRSTAASFAMDAQPHDLGAEQTVLLTREIPYLMAIRADLFVTQRARSIFFP